MPDIPTFTKLQTTVLISLLVAIFLIPYIPADILLLTDLLLVRLCIVVGLLYLGCINPTITVVAFVAICFIFIQRNTIKMKQLQVAMQQSTPESEAIMTIESPITAPPQPAFDTPSDSSIPFAPTEDSGDNSFSPVAPSMNQKIPLPTETVKGSDKAIAQLFSSINTNLMEQT
jgi:hypothetical protein